MNIEELIRSLEDVATKLEIKASELRSLVSYLRNYGVVENR